MGPAEISKLAELSKELLALEIAFGVAAVSLTVLFAITVVELKRVLSELVTERAGRKTLEVKVQFLEDQREHMHQTLRNQQEVLGSVQRTVASLITTDHLNTLARQVVAEAEVSGATGASGLGPFSIYYQARSAGSVESEDEDGGSRYDRISRDDESV